MICTYLTLPISHLLLQIKFYANTAPFIHLQVGCNDFRVTKADLNSYNKGQTTYIPQNPNYCPLSHLTKTATPDEDVATLQLVQTLFLSTKVSC